MLNLSRRPLRRVEAAPDEPTGGGWPWSLAPVRQVLTDGLELGPLTVLVGENGSGKSTLVEGLAMAYGLSPEGGSTGARHSTTPTESPLHRALHLVRNPGASRWGYFVRAETLHGLNSYLQANPNQARGPAAEAGYHHRSHGEGFDALLGSGRFRSPGLYVFDEPEAGLSFTAQLALMAQLTDVLRDEQSQVVIATHSPVLAALPGADLLQLDADGIHPRQWDQLQLVEHHRRFLSHPDAYLRHL